MRSGPTWPPAKSAPTVAETIQAFANDKDAMLQDVADDYLPHLVKQLFVKSKTVKIVDFTSDGGQYAYDIAKFRNSGKELVIVSGDENNNQHALRYVMIGDDQHAIVVKKELKDVDALPMEDNIHPAQTMLSAFTQNEVTGNKNIVVFNNAKAQAFAAIVS